jgi:hypothetical protein
LASVFDVEIEDQLVLNDFDIFAQVGADNPYDWTGTIQVNDGVLNLEFVNGIENPKINAILVQQPGASIGAAPANDLLWGDAGADRFVFIGGPVGHDAILDFNPALSGELVEISKQLAGVEHFADLYSAISDNADGDAVLTLADGDTITVDKISKAQLGPNDCLIV